MAETVEKQ